MHNSKNKKLLDVGLNANVRCHYGDCGKCTFIIIDPVAQCVTHLVVKQDEIPCREHLVPVAWIASSTHGLIHLNCTWEDFKKTEPFVEKRFVRPEGKMKSAVSFLFHPYVMSQTMMVPVTLKRIPAGELAVSRSAHVMATDGRVGAVDEFLVDPACSEITHLVVREGHLLDCRATMVPVSNIQRIEDNNVYVNLDRNALQSLPSLPLWKQVFSESEWRQYKNNESEEEHHVTTKTIQALIDDLSSKDEKTREHARSVLAVSGREPIKPLEALLNHKKHQVRWEAAKALSQMYSIMAVPGLIMAMDDREFDVRWIAAEGMVAQGRKGLPALLETLKLRPDAGWLRESAHHVLRALIVDENLETVLQPVLLALEQVDPLASLPRTAEEALKVLNDEHNL